MGTLRFDVAASGLTFNRIFTIPDAHLARLADAMIKAYGPNVVTDATTTPPTTRPMTRLEALDAWAAGIMEGTKANVQRIETQEPAKPNPITVT